jgi:RNA polymerase sigma factor (sigma-70 family)
MSGTILGDFRTLFNVGAVGSMTDGELLGRFLDDRANSGESAFGVLIHRHGPMVLGVCRRTLRESQDAEDAFQATFLILASRARSIRNRDSVGPWLLGVARKVSSRARQERFRRRVREASWIGETIRQSAASTSATESEPLYELIHQVERLPKRLRDPVILCYWRGLSYDQSASALGVTEATIRGRLARARDVLRSRLKQQDIALLLLPGGFSRCWSEVIGTRLVSTTIRSVICVKDGRSVAGLVRPSVAVLWEGASNAMLTVKWKLASVVILAGIGLLGVGPGVLAWQGRALIADAPPEKKAGGAATAPALHQDLEANGLSELVDGKIVRSEMILKDTMILAYLPDWNHGGVDNIGFEGHDGGVRTLVDWPDVPAAEAASKNLKFYLAFYSRKTVENRKPVVSQDC